MAGLDLGLAGRLLAYATAPLLHSKLVDLYGEAVALRALEVTVEASGAVRVAAEIAVGLGDEAYVACTDVYEEEYECGTGHEDEEVCNPMLPSYSEDECKRRISKCVEEKLRMWEATVREDYPALTIELPDGARAQLRLEGVRDGDAYCLHYVARIEARITIKPEWLQKLMESPVEAVGPATTLAEAVLKTLATAKKLLETILQQQPHTKSITAPHSAPSPEQLYKIQIHRQAQPSQTNQQQQQPTSQQAKTHTT